MVTNDVDLLISHWHARAEDSLELLQFKGYKAKGGEIIKCRPTITSFDDLIQMLDDEGSVVEGEETTEIITHELNQPGF